MSRYPKKKQKTIDIPIEFKRLFDRDWREAAVYGGRNSLKSHTVARLLLIRARMETTRVACFREFQNSISESSHQLLADIIAMYELNEFKVTDKSIVNEENGSDFLFKGLHHNEQSIKSIEGIDIAWCFVAGTKVCGKNIEDVLPGDYVMSYNHTTDKIESRKVLRATKRKRDVEPLYKLCTLHGSHAIIATGGHPVFVKDRGYVPIKNIKTGDIVYAKNRDTGMRPLFGRLWGDNCNGYEGKEAKIQKEWWHFLLGLRKEKHVGANETKQPNVKRRDKRKNGEVSEGKGSQAKSFRWKWKGLYDSARDAFYKTWKGVVERTGYKYGETRIITNTLQNRPGEHILQVGRGVRRGSTLWFDWKGGRRTKKQLFREYRVDSVEIQKQEDIGGYGFSDGGDYVYNLEVEVNNNYFANGVLVHNCEEAQSISENSLEVLTPTIRKPSSQIIYTYNRLLEEDPVHKRLVVEGRPNTLVLNVNYDIALKYGFMPEVLRLEMEDDKANRPSLFKHKWLGEPISAEGKIYKGWIQIDDIPHEARHVGRGLDFGYSIDPTAVVDVYEYNGGYILDELIYRKGMSNSEIATALKENDIITVADSAEPKSIDEIKAHGITIVPADKGKDSIMHGIQLVQDLRISVTQRSHNLWDEYMTYLWDRDREGHWLQHPENGRDHALDSTRYFLQRHLKKTNNDTKEFYEKLAMKKHNYRFVSQKKAKVKAGLK